MIVTKTTEQWYIIGDEEIENVADKDTSILRKVAKIYLY